MLSLMALFLCDIVLVVLLIALRLGGYQLLVRFVVWLMLILVLLVIVVVRSLHRGFLWLVGLVLFGKDFDLTEKTPAHLVGISAHSRPRVWKRLRQVGFSGLSMPDHVGRRCDHAGWGSVHEHDRVGMGMTSLGMCRPTSPGLHAFKLA